MGWTFYYTDRRSLIEDRLRDLTFTNEERQVSCKPIAHTCVGNNLWVVCERTDPAKTYRFIALFLLRRAAEGEWGYKDMDESCGPCEVNCPPSYLDLAPETEHLGGYSKQWRERVRQHWAERRQNQAFARTLKPGDKFKYGGDTAEFRQAKGRYILGISDMDGVMYRYVRAKVKPVPVPDPVPEPVVFKKEVTFIPVPK